MEPTIAEDPNTRVHPRDTAQYAALDLAVRYGADTRQNTVARAQEYLAFLNGQPAPAN